MYTNIAKHFIISIYTVAKYADYLQSFIFYSHVCMFFFIIYGLRIDYKEKHILQIIVYPMRVL